MRKTAETRLVVTVLLLFCVAGSVMLCTPAFAQDIQAYAQRSATMTVSSRFPMPCWRMRGGCSMFRLTWSPPMSRRPPRFAA